MKSHLFQQAACCCVIALLNLHLGAQEAKTTEAGNPPPFERQLSEANRLLDAGKLPEALAASKAAAKLDTNRFEAPFLAAVIFVELKQPTPARLALDAALALAPADKKPRLEALKQQLVNAKDSQQHVANAGPPPLSGAARRQYDTLVLIIEEADKSTLADERKKLLREFMARSADFIVENPNQMDIWVLRAALAVELDYTGDGWLAGQRLKELGADASNDPKTRKVMAMLDRKGWLADRWKERDWSKLSAAQTRQAAEDGDAEAQIALGTWYRLGRSGLAKDLVESVKWNRRAAEQGLAFAQTDLGVAYGFGQGVAKDDVEAVRWYRKAAVQGEGLAQEALGWRYAVGGRGVPKDDLQALTWYRMAAKHGRATAQNSCAWLLATSAQAAIRNGREAVEWATKACDATQRTNCFYLNTLAAAHAEAGDSERATKYARQSIDISDREKMADFIKGAEARLKLYEAGKPYHQPE